MQWINVKNQLPTQREYCWIFGYIHNADDKFVFEGYFDNESIDFSSFPLKKGPGWQYNAERSNYVMLDQITHWMPYFTPEPPKD